MQDYNRSIPTESAAQDNTQNGFAIDNTKGNAHPVYSFLRRFCNGIVFFINLFVSAGLIAVSYSDRISPEESQWAELVIMTLPVWIIAATLLFILDILWWKRTAMLTGVAMLICSGQIHAFSPLNIPHHKMSEKEIENSFSLMTYNVYMFLEYDRTEYEYNRQISYILKENPDIVCLQEAEYISPSKRNKITQEQIDSLDSHYPYFYTQGKNFAILSRYPIEPINIDFPAKDYSTGDMAAWRVYVKGKIINLFSVHLASLSLTDSDKDIYQGIVKLDSVTKSDFTDIKSIVLPKIKKASIDRAKQVQYLTKYINKYGGENAIVCGDFNDPVGSYPLYELQKSCRMKQAYAETAFGPTITYYPYDLFFRIDHILYRGKLMPYSMKRGDITASDHYPQIATFIIK